MSSRELKPTLANTTGQLEEQKPLISTREIKMKTFQSLKATLENESQQLVSNHVVVLKEKNEEIRTLQNDLVASKSLVNGRKVVISGLEEQLKRLSDELLQNQATKCGKYEIHQITITNHRSKRKDRVEDYQKYRVDDDFELRYAYSPFSTKNSS